MGKCRVDRVVGGEKVDDVEKELGLFFTFCISVRASMGFFSGLASTGARA